MPNVSMSAVAKAAGVSRQTLYNHYSDLEEIVVDSARAQIGMAGEIIEEHTNAAPDASTALSIFVRGTLRATDSDVGGGMSPEAEQQVMDMLEPIHQQLRSILQRGVDEGTFRADVHPADVSEIMFHMIGSGRSLIRMGRDPDQVTETVLSLMLHSVQT
jgi:TetR/AcrR family transcriptional repressor of mexCD-oprJ operon